MKKASIGIMILILLAACTSVEPTTAPMDEPLPTATMAPPTSTPLPPTSDLSADWLEYVNAELEYSLKYPVGCSFGPLGAECKQLPPEERSPDCLCFLNAENPYDVSMQSFLGNNEDGLTLVTLSVSQYDTPAFNPPEGEDWVPWLKEKWPYSEDMPDEPNLFVGGYPAARIYEPGSPQAYPAEHVFVLKEGKLIHIYMIDVDVEEHREFYDSVLTSIQFSD